MTVKGGTAQACAACKYQRRKCSADCPLAPYFPADQPRQFQNAHRLFGVSNILRILNKLDDPSQRAEAMRSILYEANIRYCYPVYGCLGVISALHLQLHHAQLQLHAINAHLAFHRSQHQHSIASPPLQLSTSSSSSSSPHETSNFLPLDNATTAMSLADRSHNSDVYNDTHHPLWSLNHTDTTTNYAGVGEHMAIAEGVQTYPFGFGMAVGPCMQPRNKYDEITPYFDAINEDRQSYIDSKEPYESSSETSPKDMIQTVEHQVTDDELKRAAACFTLTSIMS